MFRVAQRECRCEIGENGGKPFSDLAVPESRKADFPVVRSVVGRGRVPWAPSTMTMTNEIILQQYFSAFIWFAIRPIKK